MLEEEKGYLFGKHFQSGQNVNMYSLDANHTFVNHFVEHKLVVEDTIDNLLFNPEWSKPLHNFIRDNYTTLLTRQQIEYLECPADEVMTKYSKEQRSQFRRYICKRVMPSLIGMNIKYYHRLNTHLVQLAVINDILFSEGTSLDIGNSIKKHLEDVYMEELVYERLPQEHRASIVTAFITGEPVCSHAIHEVLNCLDDDYAVICATFKAQEKKS